MRGDIRSRAWPVAHAPTHAGGGARQRGWRADRCEWAGSRVCSVCVSPRTCSPHLAVSALALHARRYQVARVSCSPRHAGRRGAACVVWCVPSLVRAYSVLCVGKVVPGRFGALPRALNSGEHFPAFPAFFGARAITFPNINDTSRQMKLAHGTRSNPKHPL